MTYTDDLAQEKARQMTVDQVIHILRNQWGFSEIERRAARLKAAELLERISKP